MSSNIVCLKERRADARNEYAELFNEYMETFNCGALQATILHKICELYHESRVAAMECANAEKKIQ